MVWKKDHHHSSHKDLSITKIATLKEAIEDDCNNNGLFYEHLNPSALMSLQRT